MNPLYDEIDIYDTDCEIRLEGESLPDWIDRIAHIIRGSYEEARYGSRALHEIAAILRKQGLEE